MKKLLFITIFSILSVLIWQPANATIPTSVALPFDGPASLWWASTYEGHGEAWDFNLAADADNGAPLYAMFNGIVVDPPEPHPLCGIGVDIWAEDYGVRIHYCHLLNTSVSIGQSVSAGDFIGRIDNTGGSYGAHLHLHIYNVDGNDNILSSVNLRSLTIFASISSWTGSGGGGSSAGGGSGAGGGPSPPPGSTPEIGDLKLEVSWPKVPGMNQTLNELVEGVGAINLSDLIKFIYGFSLWIGGIVAFFTLIYVGYMYIFSGANPGMRQYAKKRAIGVVSGITILLLAVVILNTINPDLSRISTTIEPSDVDLKIADKPGADYELRDGDEPPPYIPPAIQNTFTANDKEGSIFISPSESVTLEWATEEADRCVASTNYPTSSIWAGVKNPPEGGSENIGALAIEGTHRFSITCTKSTIATLSADVLITVSSGSSTGIQPTANLQLILPTGQIIEDSYTFTSIEEEFDSKIKWFSTNADSCLLTAPAPMDTTSRKTADEKWLVLPFGNGNYIFGITCSNNSSGLSDLDIISITKAL